MTEDIFNSREWLKAMSVSESAREFSAAEDSMVAYVLMKRGLIIGEPTGAARVNRCISPCRVEEARLSVQNAIIFPMEASSWVKACCRTWSFT